MNRADTLTQKGHHDTAPDQGKADLDWILACLHQAKIPTQQHHHCIVSHPNRNDLAWALFLLLQKDILDEDNFITVVSHANPQPVARALLSLHQAGILTPETRNGVSSNNNPKELAWALKRLHRPGLWTSKNITVVASHHNPDMLVSMLLCLNQARSLTPEKLNTAATHDNPKGLVLAPESLSEAKILTQASFALLVNHPVLININPNVFMQIPEHLMSQAIFDQLILYAQQDNPERTIATFIDRLTGTRNDPATFNQAQSTHHTSVHQSASESAAKLAARYSPIINDHSELEKVIETVKHDILSLPAGKKNDAAKRCIKRITLPDYTFTDPQSEVSLRQLLALAYTAVEDDKTRKGSKEDAMHLFIEGLYDIQRGGNLSETGKDNNKADNPICLAGAFNKLIEKLQGIDPDCQILFITPEYAGIKLPIVIAEEATKYLGSLNSIDFIKLLGDIDRDDIAAIWDNIQENVSKRIFDDFNSLYQDRKDPAFTDLINSGQNVALKKSKPFQTRLQELLVNRRHNGQDEQKIYDIKYGLVLYSKHGVDAVAENMTSTKPLCL